MTIPPPSAAPPREPPETVTPPARAGFAGLTYRSLLLGTLAAVTMGVWGPYSLLVIKSSRITFGYLPFGSLLMLFALAGVANTILRRWWPRNAFEAREMVVIFTMSLVATTIPDIGLGCYLFAIPATPGYFPSPENQWADYILPFVPNWIAPHNVNQAIDWFYNGLPEGERIPWEVWALPLFWWFCFIGALFSALFCGVAMFRKQWIEHERLLFPLMQVPQELIGEHDPGQAAPRIMQSRLFWAAFAITCFIPTWNILNHAYPGIPRLPTYWGEIQLHRQFPAIRAVVAFPLWSIGYLANVDVLFSLWFFHLLSILQVGLFSRFGFSIGAADAFCSYYPEIGWQNFGAFMVFVAWGIWVARRHLGAVLRKAITNDPEIDDSNELLSYRTAVVGLILGTLYICGFLIWSGMEFHVLVIFMIATYAIFFGMTRVVCESGTQLYKAPIIPQTFTYHALGVENIAPSSMAAMSFTYVWIVDVWSIFMPPMAHGAKLAHELGMYKRAIVWAVAISMAVTFLVTCVYFMHTTYSVGAYNLGYWIFRGADPIGMSLAVKKMQNPTGPDTARLTAFGAGSAVMSFLIFMRYRFAWWPLHPIGYTAPYTMAMRVSFLSIFLAWLCKWLVIKLGGIPLYRKSLPLFYGMLIGYVTGCFLAFIADALWFPGEGHLIYWGGV